MLKETLASGTILGAKDGEKNYDHLKPNLNGPWTNIISHLWKPNSEVWDEDKVSAYFDDTFKNDVLNTPVINDELDDTVSWIHTPNAKCAA